MQLCSPIGQPRSQYCSAFCTTFFCTVPMHSVKGFLAYTFFAIQPSTKLNKLQNISIKCSCYQVAIYEF